MLPKVMELIQFTTILKTCSYNFKAVPLDAESFYKRVKNAFAVIATTERCLYANVILTKGIILPN